MMSETFSKDEVQLRVSGKDKEKRKRESKGLIKIRQERAEKNCHLNSFNGRIQFQKKCLSVRVGEGIKCQKKKNKDQVTWSLT